jgi:hypothetical protein
MSRGSPPEHREGLGARPHFQLGSLTHSIIGRVRLEQEKTHFGLVARTSFAEPLHEQPHQPGMLG